tara:strand:- start:169 stop:495 length:327 start_codon:yes stop_codon:yes gene_type:complete
MRILPYLVEERILFLLVALESPLRTASVSGNKGKEGLRGAKKSCGGEIVIYLLNEERRCRRFTGKKSGRAQSKKSNSTSITKANDAVVMRRDGFRTILSRLKLKSVKS